MRTSEGKARAKGIEHQSYHGERGLRQHRDYPISSDILADVRDSLVEYIENRRRASHAIHTRRVYAVLGRV
jgi:hypothetical protein